MRNALLAILLLGVLVRTNAQPNLSRDRTYESRKTLSFGAIYQNVNSSSLSRLSEQYGYGKLPPGFFCISIQNSVQLENGLGFFLEGNLGGGNSEKPEQDKAAGIYYYRLEVGATYRVVQSKHVFCDAHLGVGFAHYKLNLTDRLQDSTVMQYLGNTADRKSIDGSQPLMDLGFLAGVRNSPFISLGAGYIVPFQNNRWHIGGKVIDDGPGMALGNYYIKACLGFCFRRMISPLPERSI